MAELDLTKVDNEVLVELFVNSFKKSDDDTISDDSRLYLDEIKKRLNNSVKTNFDVEKCHRLLNREIKIQELSLKRVDFMTSYTVGVIDGINGAYSLVDSCVNISESEDK